MLALPQSGTKNKPAFPPPHARHYQILFTHQKSQFQWLEMNLIRDFEGVVVRAANGKCSSNGYEGGWGSCRKVEREAPHPGELTSLRIIGGKPALFFLSKVSSLFINKLMGYTFSILLLLLFFYYFLFDTSSVATFPFPLVHTYSKPRNTEIFFSHPTSLSHSPNYTICNVFSAGF